MSKAERWHRRGGRRTVTLVVAGLVAGASAAFAAPAFAGGPPAAEAAHADPLVPGTPCSVTAKACVDLDSQQSWLIKDGAIMTGPVPAATGGQGTVTPVGHSLRVYRKDQDHLSQEYRQPDGSPAPMPWAVFFDDGGIAFHEGNTASSSGGCVRLARDNAIAWFNYLQIGDQVQVVRASEEKAARAR